MIRILCAAVIGVSTVVTPAVADSLPPLVDGRAPQNVEELWNGYDPTAEPLDVQVVHEWRGENVTTQMLVYTVGTFKGVKSRIGAYYAFPTLAGGRVPGILQMHGGGQRAQRQIVEAHAANGYAAIAINWGGNPMDDQQAGDPGTDWGAIDPTQNTHNSHYASLAPDDRTIDAVVSPRNNNWFPIVIAARRALTFLQQQPVVDPDRLGVEGHSMGGKLTVMTAGVDRRVKAAAPSCGGAGAAPQKLIDRPGAAVGPRNSEPLYYQTIDDLNYIRRITCPILYVGPHNDFNASLDNVYANWRQMPSTSIHFSVSPHFNHRHIPESSFAAAHFFNTILKGQGRFPTTPDLRVVLNPGDGTPQAIVTPDDPARVVGVDVYYSMNPHALTRFWRKAPVVRDGDRWSARLPVFSTDMPLFVMANVFYPLQTSIVGPPWNRTSPQTFVVSSWGLDFDPPQLQAAGVKATDSPQRVIETEFTHWHDWYQLDFANREHAQCITRKLTDPAFRAPDGAALAIDVRDPQGGELALTFEVNGWSAYAGVKSGSYYAAKPIARSDQWQTLTFTLADLQPIDERTAGRLDSWQYITELGIVAHVRSRRDGKPVILAGSSWHKEREIRNLRWVGR